MAQKRKARPKACFSMNQVGSTNHATFRFARLIPQGFFGVWYGTSFWNGSQVVL